MKSLFKAAFAFYMKYFLKHLEDTSCLYAICLQSQICLIGKSLEKVCGWWNQIFVCCQTEANLLPTNYSIKLQFLDSIRIKKMQEPKSMLHQKWFHHIVYSVGAVGMKHKALILWRKRRDEQCEAIFAIIYFPLCPCKTLWISSLNFQRFFGINA